jgi:hypothetical protein
VRRIVLILVLVAVVGLAGFLLLRPKGGARSAKKADSGDSTATGKSTVATTVKKTGGKVAGKVKPKTAAERKAETKRIRDAERKRKRDLRRAESERRKALRYARSRRGKRRTRSKGQFYVLKAIVALGDGSYALIDNRRVQVGDVLMGRRIVTIMPDRIEVEAFGKRSTVRVGEGLLPPTFGARSRR